MPQRDATHLDQRRGRHPCREVARTAAITSRSASARCVPACMLRGHFQRVPPRPREPASREGRPPHHERTCFLGFPVSHDAIFTRRRVLEDGGPLLRATTSTTPHRGRSGGRPGASSGRCSPRASRGAHLLEERGEGVGVDLERRAGKEILALVAMTPERSHRVVPPLGCGLSRIRDPAPRVDAQDERARTARTGSWRGPRPRYSRLERDR